MFNIKIKKIMGRGLTWIFRIKKMFCCFKRIIATDEHGNTRIKNASFFKKEGWVLGRTLQRTNRPTPPKEENMFKKVLIVLSVCFLLGMATKAEVENVKEEAEKEVVNSETKLEMGAQEPLIKPSEEPALYKTSLNIETPSEGIATGHVIAYGHYIGPPYKLQIKNDTMLFINGVQIFPVLPSKFEIEKKKREEKMLEERYREANRIAAPYFERLDSLYDKIGDVYAIIELQKGRVKALDSIYKLAEAETLIVKMDTTYIGEDDCMLMIYNYIPGYDKFPEDTSSFLFRLYGGNSSSGYRAPPTPWRKDFDAVKKYVNYAKNQTEKDLKNNEVIFYASSGEASYRREYRLWGILEILKSDTLKVEEKIERLNKIVVESAGKDLIYNFDPSEWPEKQEDNNK